MALNSWWDLGEWVVVGGEKLDHHDITCPFCLESGNFKVQHHSEKKKTNGHKILNFDTLKCNNCAGYVMVLWSATSDHHEVYDYRVLPWPLKITKYPVHWPETVGRYWLQAHQNIIQENWDAAALMARSALQVALRQNGAIGNNLNQEINDLASKGILPPIIEQWSHELRELGNESAHPTPETPATNSKDAQDIVSFLDFLMKYLYDLPYEIENYKKRKTS